MLGKTTFSIVLLSFGLGIVATPAAAEVHLTIGGTVPRDTRQP